MELPSRITLEKGRGRSTEPFSNTRVRTGHPRAAGTCDPYESTCLGSSPSSPLDPSLLLIWTLVEGPGVGGGGVSSWIPTSHTEDLDPAQGS